MKKTLIALAILVGSSAAMAADYKKKDDDKSQNVEQGQLQGQAQGQLQGQLQGQVANGGQGGAGGNGYGYGVGIAGAAAGAIATGGSSSTGAIDNKSSATAGSVGNVGMFSSVKSLSPESSSNSSVLASGNSSSNSGVVGSGNSAAIQGQNSSVDIKVEGDNQFTVEAARIAAGITEDGTRDRSADDNARNIAIIEADARIEAARLAQTVKNTPSVSGPALTSSNDTCMGSSSGSANVPGIGIGFGTSWVDGNCKMLKNSRELWNMGMKAASLALMCNDTDNRAALELTGFECPQTTAAKKQAAVAAAPATQAQAPMSTASGSVPYTGNDPIVRARYGLQ